MFEIYLAATGIYLIKWCWKILFSNFRTFFNIGNGLTIGHTLTHGKRAFLCSNVYRFLPAPTPTLPRGKLLSNVTYN